MSKQVRHISDFIESWAPFSTQAEYDNSGLLIGSKNSAITGILTCLDVTESIVDEAIAHNCNLIVAHHPVIFRKLQRIDPDTDQGSLLYRLIRNDISVLAVHTNLDAAHGGVSFVLADRIGLVGQEFLSWHDEEQTHGYGVIGSLRSPLHQSDFLNHICDVLETPAIRFAGSAPQVSRVAVCGGTGISLASVASAKKADAFVTADIKYHEYFDYPGMLKVDAGHFETEIHIAGHLAKRLSEAFSDLHIMTSSVQTNPMKLHISTELNSSNTQKPIRS